MGEQQWKLVDEKTGAEIRSGDRVDTGNGQTGTLAFFRPPHKPSSTGRVYVDVDGDKYQAEWFPSVIGARIERVEG